MALLLKVTLFNGTVILYKSVLNVKLKSIITKFTLIYKTVTIV